MSRRVDLNADLAEGAGFDTELMTLVTSANLCCGAHAGSPAQMRESLSLARQQGVVVGAHPGYPDREQFGRRELTLTPVEITATCRDQLHTLNQLAAEVGWPVSYVKPHGALYNQAARDRVVAEAVLDAVAGFAWPVVGLPGSVIQRVAQERGLRFVSEGFADRRYRSDGTLVPRTEPDAMIHDPQEAVLQVERLIRVQGVETICVHGDNSAAVAFTRAIRSALLAAGFRIVPWGPSWGL